MEHDENGGRDEHDAPDNSASDATPDHDRRRDEPNPTSQVRIAAVQAAVAAGLAPSARRDTTADDAGRDDPTPSGVVELPDWTDPPTGQVPRVLLEDGALGDDTLLVTRGPSWREEGTDWDEHIDLSVFADDAPSAEAEIAGTNESPLGAHLDPFGFGDLGLETTQVASETTGESDVAAWSSVLGATELEGELDLGRPRGRGRPRGAHRAARARQQNQAFDRQAPAVAARVVATAPTTNKRVVVATLTGVATGALAVLCFLGGSITSLALVVVGLLLAAGEVFAVVRRAGYKPATLPGLLAVGGCALGAYLRGTSGIVFVLGLFVIVGSLWYLAGRIGALPVANLGASLLVVCWIGLLGSFAALLLAPSIHPHRHGVALLVALVGLTVVHDVGSYGVGSLVGRHKLAPRVSPNKTIEGLIGGSILVFLIAGLVIPHLHPLSLTFALELAIVVIVFAPLGDLVESLIKRELGVKDMGSLLPGHGGVIDRVDAMLFVLPATFYLASLHHLG